MQAALHFILSIIIASSISRAIPEFLQERYANKYARAISWAMLCIICLFPIIPDFVPSFILSFALFALYMMLFYKGALVRMAAFCSLFFSIIGSWSFFTISWLDILINYHISRIFHVIVLFLIIALCLTYFSIFREYIKRFADKSVLDSLTEGTWGYIAFIALCPPLLILMLVSSPPMHLTLTIMMTLFSMCASTAMFPLLYQAGKSTKLAEENSKLKERTGYYQEVENQQLSFRKFKHDLMNQFTVIATYLDLGENDKAIAYFKELGTEFSSLTRTFTDNTLINAVLNSKYQMARIQGIDMDITVDIHDITLDETELCTLIANSLDNALEADPPDRTIKASLIEKDDVFTFICQNSYSGEIRQAEDGSFITHKNDSRNHGLGINNIKDAVRSMGGTVSFTADGSTFTVAASIPLGGRNGR